MSDFYSNLEVQLKHVLHRTLKLDSFEIFVKNSCCAPRFPLIARCYDIVNRQTTSFTLCEGVGVGHFTSDSATLVSFSITVNKSRFTGTFHVGVCCHLVLVLCSCDNCSLHALSSLCME